MSQPDAPPSIRSRFTFGARPTIGAGPALKAVAQDTSELVRAEIQLAKAELTAGLTTNATGVGMLVGAAVMLWLAVQGLLITLGFVLSIWLPGWAAALIVSVVPSEVVCTLSTVPVAGTPCGPLYVTLWPISCTAPESSLLPARFVTCSTSVNFASSLMYSLSLEGFSGF